MGMWLFKTCACLQLLLCVAMDKLPVDDANQELILIPQQQIDQLRNMLTLTVPFANMTPTDHVHVPDVVDEKKKETQKKRKLLLKERAKVKKSKLAAHVAASSSSVPLPSSELEAKKKEDRKEKAREAKRIKRLDPVYRNKERVHDAASKKKNDLILLFVPKDMSTRKIKTRLPRRSQERIIPMNVRLRKIKTRLPRRRQANNFI